MTAQVMRAFLVLLIAPAALATPFGVRMTLADDPTSTVAISWNDDAPVDAAVPNVVAYGTTAGALMSTFVTFGVVIALLIYRPWGLMGRPE